jgi:6-phosphogluconolactonase (cycloisomerase 2 family)
MAMTAQSFVYSPNKTAVIAARLNITGRLFVSNFFAARVRIYDARTGRHLRNPSSQSDELHSPIHLFLSSDGRYLFIGSGGTDSILRHDLQRGSTTAFVEPKSAGLNGPAGMAFFGDGFLYVASRNSRKFFVTARSTVVRAASLSSKTWQITPNF